MRYDRGSTWSEFTGLLPRYRAVGGDHQERRSVRTWKGSGRVEWDLPVTNPVTSQRENLVNVDPRPSIRARVLGLSKLIRMTQNRVTFLSFPRLFPSASSE
jgi:hypothetical protein